MGYHTYYRLGITPPPGPALLADLAPIKDGQGLYLLTGEADSCSWYEHEREILDLSARHTEVLFRLWGEGEEVGDQWVKFFLGGRVETHKAPEWTPPPEPSSAFLTGEITGEITGGILYIQEDLTASLVFANAEIDRLKNRIHTLVATVEKLTLLAEGG